MSDQIASLSDGELRAQLIEMGCANLGPITATTRKLMEKRLMRLITDSPVVKGGISEDFSNEYHEFSSFVPNTNRSADARPSLQSTPPRFHEESGEDLDDDMAGEESYEYNPNYESRDVPKRVLYPDLDSPQLFQRHNRYVFLIYGLKFYFPATRPPPPTALRSNQ